MVMRVTNSVLFQQSLGAMSNKYQEIKNIQEKSLTGKEVNRPADNPTATFRDIVFSSEVSEVKSLQKTTDMASQRMIMAETNVQIMHEKFLEAQDIVMQLGNSTVNGTPEVLTAEASKPMAMFQDLMKYANAELDGVPLFGGGRTNEPYSESSPDIEGIRKRALGSDNHANFENQTDLSVTKNSLDSTAPGYPGMPASVKMTYDATAGSYAVNVDGTDKGSYTPASDEIDLSWVKISTGGTTPTDGDAFYFEVTPKYLGGQEDRAVKILDGNQLPGNVTGQELMGGEQPTGRGKNLFSIMAGLRGALSRGDTAEVGALLGDIHEGRAQVSDVQAITGIRTVQIESVTNSLSLDQDSLEIAKATNIEADLFEVLTSLEQTTQAMQIMTNTERQVLNQSLLDFIR